MSHNLTPNAVWAALGLLLLAFLRDMFYIAREAFAWLRTVSTILRSQPALLVVLLLVVIPLGLMFLRALCPPLDTDEIGYHLTAPKRWLEAGSLTYLPTLLHTQAPMGVQMLFTICLAVWSDTSAKLVHWGIGCLAILSTFVFARRLRHWTLALPVFALTFFFWGPNTGLIEMSSANIDLAVYLTTVIVLLCWLLWHRSLATEESGLLVERRSRFGLPGESAFLVAGALCAGFATTFKLTGGSIGLAFAVVAFADVMRATKRNAPSGSRPLVAAAKVALVVVVLSALPVMPWLYRTWAETGNPVYPMLSTVFPTRDWGSDIARASMKYFRYSNWGWMFLSFPLSVRKMMVLVMQAIVFISGLAGLFYWRRAARPDKRLISEGSEGWDLTLYGLLLLLMGTQFVGLSPRLLCPLVIPGIFAVSLAASPFLVARRTGQIALIIFLGLGTLLFTKKNFREAPTSFAAATGRIDRWSYLTHAGKDMEVWQMINKDPEPGTVLSSGFFSVAGIGNGMTYYCDRPVFITDWYQQKRFRMNNWDDYVADIQRNGVRFIVTPNDQSFFLEDPDYPAAQNEWPFAKRMGEEYGHLVFQGTQLRMYVLNRLPKQK